MKEIKPVYIVAAVILGVLSLAIVHWIILPKEGLPKVAEFLAETAQPEKLPVLPQNELYNASATPSFSKDPRPFQESVGQDALEPKPAASDKKAEF